MSETERIIVKIPKKPASSYRKLSDGFDLFYKLTNVQVELEDKRQRRRPQPVRLPHHKRDKDFIYASTPHISLPRSSSKVSTQLPRGNSVSPECLAFCTIAPRKPTQMLPIISKWARGIGNFSIKKPLLKPANTIKHSDIENLLDQKKRQDLRKKRRLTPMKLKPRYQGRKGMTKVESLPDLHYKTVSDSPIQRLRRIERRKFSHAFQTVDLNF